MKANHWGQQDDMAYLNLIREILLVGPYHERLHFVGSENLLLLRMSASTECRPSNPFTSILNWINGLPQPSQWFMSLSFLDETRTTTYYNVQLTAGYEALNQRPDIFAYSSLKPLFMHERRGSSQAFETCPNPNKSNVSLTSFKPN